jgi:chemotaxis protein MotB
MAQDEPKKKKAPAGAPLWMCTFADMMSLLLCFFVLILTFATLDEVKFVKVSGSLKDAFGVQKDEEIFTPLGQTMISPMFRTVPFDVRQEVMDIVKELSASGLVEAAETKEGIVVRVDEALAFASGKAELQPRFQELLDRIGKVIAAAEADVVVNGHTDNVPLRPGGEFSSNWTLSAARSVAVVEYWEKKFAMPAARFSAVGHAAGKPVASNNSEEGRGKNRRVEFLIRPGPGGQAFIGIGELQERPGPSSF